MPEYIAPEPFLSQYGSIMNSRSVWDGQIDFASPAGGLTLPGIVSNTEKRATVLPNWLIVAAVIAFILLTHEK